MQHRYKLQILIALICVIFSEAVVSAEIDKSKRWALIIGIGEYEQQDEVNPLPYAAKDALAIRDMLTHPQTGTFLPENVILYTHATDVKPTRGNIFASLETFKTQMRSDEMLLIFFSGHGDTIPEAVMEGGREVTKQTPYLLPYNVRFIVPKDTAIAMSEWESRIEAIPARLKIVLLDACHSGGARKDMGGRGEMAIPFENAIPPFTLSSSQREQASHWDEDLKHGVFTYYLLESLRGAADSDGSRTVTLREASQYVQTKVRAWGIRNQRPQDPFLTASAQLRGIVLSSIQGVQPPATSADQAPTPPQTDPGSVVPTPPQDELGFGLLFVKALVGDEPVAASVFIDGEKQKKDTPLTVPAIATGSHRVRVSKSLYHDYTETLVVAKDQKHPVTALLQPAFGSLVIRSVPSSGRVELTDAAGTRRGGGTTPFEMERLPSGAYQIRVNKDRYYPHTAPVVIRESQQTTEIFTFTPRFGTLKVVTDPTGVTVLLAGQPQGTTPLTVEVDSGVYALELQKELHLSWSGEVEVRDGEATDLTQKLTPDFGVLDVRVTPTGVAIRVDGVDMGKTPARLKLSPGTRRIEINGGDEYITQVHPALFLARDVTERLTGALERKTGTLRVISTPPEAAIHIDGKDYGLTPNVLCLPTGSYTLRLFREGFRDYEETVTVLWNETVERDVELPIGPPPSPKGMVLIPAGSFQMGSDSGGSDEKPVHTVYLDAFYIDVYEVTNAQYRQFVEATGHREPPLWNNSDFNQSNRPVVGVTWHDAMAYAQWADKRLPTEAEWEKAARGGLAGKTYPWGDEISHDDANYGGTGGRDKWGSETAPVGSFPPNSYGLYDMAGNVREWCLDEYDSGFYAKSPRNNPLAGGDISQVISNFTNAKTARVLRGGSWADLLNNLRVADRFRDNPADTYFLIGFRCARAVSP